MKSMQDFKMVIVLDNELPAGLQCNTAAVLSLTLGNKIEGLIDKDLVDGSNDIHTGLTNQPLPILKSNSTELMLIRTKAKKCENELLVVDITDAAQSTKNYQDYEEKLKSKTSDQLVILGLAIAGRSKDVKSLTGNLGLLK